MFRRLTRRGVAALLSNSDHPAIRDLYPGDEFLLAEVAMSRAINSKTTRRAPIRELLIGNLGAIMAPDMLGGVARYVIPVSGLGEFIFTLWLLAMGVDPQKWRARAGVAGSA